MSLISSLPQEIPVLIVGGGPVGITCALLLEQQGIESLVVERTDALPTTPRAHVIRRRSMEIFEKIGVANEIEAAVPGPETKHITWVAQLAGKEIGRLNLIEDNADFSWTNLPQNLLCPILLERAQKSELAHMATHTHCMDIKPAPNGVSARIERAGEQIDIQARWLIAADGAGSATRDKLGIQMEGHENLAEFYMVHFKADLTEWIKNRPSPLFWILNPEGSGTLIVHEMDKSHVFMVPAKAVDVSESELVAYIKRGLGLDVPIELLSMGKWTAHSQIAETYRKGRSFLVGDAAHRFPPTGGLGLNTGVLDVHNLAWKLALVDKGLADEALLDSYDTECRPVASTNAETSMHNMTKLRDVYQALGTFKTPKDLEVRLETMTKAERKSLQKAIENQTDHFVSDGILPGAWTGEPHPSLGLPRAYRGFKLIIGSPPKWAKPVRQLETKYDVRIETTIRLQVNDPDGLIRDGEALLLRPDDQIAGKGSRPEDIEAALVRALAGPQGSGKARRQQDQPRLASQSSP